MGSIPEDDREAGFSLGSTEREGKPQFRVFAERILEYLRTAGLPELDKLRRAPEGNTVAPNPKADAGPYDPDLRRVTLENGQKVYVHFDAGRSRFGHKQIAVLTTRQAEEGFVGSAAWRAIVAAVTAMDFRTVDMHRLRRALARIDGPLTKSAAQHSRETAEKMRREVPRSRDPDQRKEDLRPAIEFQRDLQDSSLESTYWHSFAILDRTSTASRATNR